MLNSYEIFQIGNSKNSKHATQTKKTNLRDFFKEEQTQTGIMFRDFFHHQKKRFTKIKRFLKYNKAH